MPSRPPISVIRPQLPDDPIHFDPGPTFAAGGASHAALAALADPLDGARAAVLADTAAERHATPDAAAWITLPDRVLTDFRTERPGSDLARLLATARRIREAVDRVLVLGDHDLLAGPRAVFEACCHPHHNELPRCARGGRPRLSFLDCGLDNDLAQGMLDLVAPRRDSGGALTRAAEPPDLLDRWGLIVVGRGGDEFATAATARVFLAAILEQFGGDTARASERIVAITSDTGRLAAVARAVGCRDTWAIPAAGPGPTAVFTAAGVLPCAIVGIDVVRLLEGAATMLRRFREAPVAENPVLQFAGAAYLAGAQAGRVRPVPWRGRLEPLSRWYDALLARDDADRGRHAAGTLATRVLVAEMRRDRLALPAIAPLDADQDGLEGLVGSSWPALQAAAVGVAREADAAARPAGADILLPRLDEHTLGQLLQMLMLATLVERRLEPP